MVSPVLIGRREELSALSALLEQVLGGEPAFALISGEAGVGKTRLVGELGAGEDAGFRVLTGQCVELGAEGLPLAPLVDALRTLAQTMPREELGLVLGPAARRGLAGLLPELAPDTDPSMFPGSPGDGLRKSQLLELVLGALTRLSVVKPVIFVIEDLHWADQSTLDLTAFLVRSLRAAPVMLAITYRSDELHRRHPLRPLVTSWERDRSANPVRAAKVRPGRSQRTAGGPAGRDSPARGHRRGLRPIRWQRVLRRRTRRRGAIGRRPGRPAAIAKRRASHSGRRLQRRRPADAARCVGRRQACRTGCLPRSWAWRRQNCSPRCARSWRITW